MADTEYEAHTQPKGITRRSALLGLGMVPVLAALGRPVWAQDVTGELELGIGSFHEPQMRLVIDAYQAQFPGVKVTMSTLAGGSDQLRQNLITRQMANRLPDIVTIVDRFPRQFADSGLTADLRPYLERGGPVSRELFAKAFIDQYTVQGGQHAGEIHGMPIGADTVVIFYNKGHFDEAGIAYPTDDWTWDDLIAAAGKLTVKDGATTVRFGFGTRLHWHATYVPMIAAHGGSFLDPSGRAQLTSPEAIATFNLLLGQVKAGVFATPSAIRSAGGEAAGFANELYSMLAFTRGAGLPTIRAAMRPDMDFDVALVPRIGDRRHNGMGSIGLSLTPTGAQNLDVVASFFDFLYAEDGGMRILSESYAVVPPISSLFESPIWRDLAPPPASNHVFVDAMAYGTPNPAGIPADAQSVIDTAMAAVVDSVLINDVPVEQALATAEAEINAAIDRANSAS